MVTIPHSSDVLGGTRRAGRLGDWLEARRRQACRVQTPDERLARALELSDPCWALRDSCSKKDSIIVSND